jgi:hypothetical protein
MTATELAYDDLLAHALVGTERRPLPEATLLARAAVEAARRNAGYVPLHRDEPLPPPAPPDPAGRPASSRAAQVLELLVHRAAGLHGAEGAVIEQWLRRAAAVGVRPPDRLLPALLNLGGAALRDAIRDAIGPRGWWLAAQYDDWSWVTPPPDDVAGFPTARRADRIALLTSLRTRDPDRGRELLAATWSGESANDRAAFLDTFSGTVVAGDEPFLEAALDDRSGRVRAVAARLLDALPASQRALRMAERVRPLVAVTGRTSKTLSVTLPEALDDAARRDGVDDDPPPKVGLKSWWFIQLVGGAPLAMWSAWGEPAELVALAAKEAELVDGWTWAALAQRNEEWCDALFDDLLDADVLAVLPAPEAETAVARNLDRIPDKKLAAILAAVPAPWSGDFSEAVLDRMTRVRQRVDTFTATLAAALDPRRTERIPGWPALDRALELRRIIDEELQ